METVNVRNHHVTSEQILTITHRVQQLRGCLTRADRCARSSHADWWLLLIRGPEVLGLSRLIRLPAQVLGDGPP